MALWATHDFPAFDGILTVAVLAKSSDYAIPNFFERFWKAHLPTEHHMWKLGNKTMTPHEDMSDTKYLRSNHYSNNYQQFHTYLSQNLKNILLKLILWPARWQSLTSSLRHFRVVKSPQHSKMKLPRTYESIIQVVRIILKFQIMAR